MMMKNRWIYGVGCLLISGTMVMAQTQPSLGEVKPEGTLQKKTKAWEFGLGGALINWNRVSLTGFQNSGDQYRYNLKAHHLMGGANLYIARELNSWFYLDLQGTVGTAKNEVAVDGKKRNFLYMGGLGLQWRLSPLFKSKYVEPYLRVGMNYLYKDFKTIYTGGFVDDATGEAQWVASDTWNPDGRSNDKRSFLPLSLGAGVNAWLNNSLGLGLQAEYLMPIEKNLPRFAQMTLRVMWRIGGSDKRPEPLVRYVEVEKPVERIVERIVEKEVPARPPAVSQICEMIDHVNFEFDSDVLTEQSEALLDKVAYFLKQFDHQHFLITGFTDAKGSDGYNMNLSRNRARVVMEALQKRGVAEDKLKARGIGKRAAAMLPGEVNQVREGDRKVTIERISNLEYWNKLPKQEK